MEYLLEIYTEEIPATFLNGAVKDLKDLSEKKLSEYSIGYRKIETYGTPKRLVLFVKGLEEKEADGIVEVKGPPAKVAFNKDGTEKPVYGKFLESNNLEKKDVFIKETKRGKYLFGKKVVKGKVASEIVRELSLYALLKLHFPKTMHWEESNVRFVRPIRYILSLLDNEIVEFEFAGVKSGRVTFGLRIDKPKEIEIKNPSKYFKKLKENYIILSYINRKQIVERRAKEEANKSNALPIYSRSHLEEVTNLTEYPTPFLASIGKEALSIPECITQSIIEKDMKSFAVGDSTGHLLPYFIGIRNGSSDFIEIVKAGYEKVVRARVLDGKFFFEEDKKTKLENLVEKLSTIMFMKGLGTMKDKTDRIIKLSEKSTEFFNLKEDTARNLKRAALLSKADLLTNVVREFTNLQGIMGGIYAELQGENKAVASAISEQYLPRFTADKIPQSIEGKYLSLFDKVDTLAGAFGIHINVSGSKDPFGLRRAGTGIMQIVSSFESVKFPLSKIIEEAINIHKELNKKVEDKKNEIITFLKDREKAILKDQDIRYDVINAVVALPIDFAPTYSERARVLMKHLDEETLQFVALSNKRVSNILQKANMEFTEIDKNLFREHDEENLLESIEKAEMKVEKNLALKNYNGIMETYFALSPAIAQFFDNVLVMDKDEKVKNNRLLLLKKLQDLFKQFSDFSQIVIEKKVNF